MRSADTSWFMKVVPTAEAVRRAGWRACALAAPLVLWLAFAPSDMRAAVEGGVWSMTRTLLFPYFGGQLTPLPGTPWPETAIATAAAFLVFLYGPHRPVLHQLVLLIVLLTVAALGTHYGVVGHGFKLSTLGLFALPSIASLGQMIHEHLRVSRRTAMLADVLAPAMSPAMLRTVLRAEVPVRLDGTSRRMTFLSVRFRGFSALEDALRGHPATFAEIINSAHTALIDTLFDGQGQLAHLTATGFTGFFNAPLDLPDHEFRACETALRMVERLDTLNEKIEARARRLDVTLDLFSISVGIATGQGLAFELGPGARGRYGVAGEPVLLAEALAERGELYGPAVLIGEHTRNAVEAKFALLEIDRVAFPAEAPPQRVFTIAGTPLTRVNPGFRALAEGHTAIFDAIGRGDLATAETLLTDCAHLSPSSRQLYGLLARRVEFLRRGGLPDGFDGVFRADL